MQPLPSSTHRPPTQPWCTWMARRAPCATGLQPPRFSRAAPDGSCAKRPRTRPQRDRTSGQLLCSHDGPLRLTHTSHLPCLGTTSTLSLFSQASLRPGMIQGWGWIKCHAGIIGNEISEAYSTWAAHVIVWDPSLLPPPPR